MTSLPKTFRFLRRINAETVQASRPYTATSSIRFNKTIGSDTQEKIKNFDAIVQGIESFAGVTLTDNTVLEQIKADTEAVSDAHLLKPGTHKDALSYTLEIDAVSPVTLQAEKLRLKHKALTENTKSKNNVLE